MTRRSELEPCVTEEAEEQAALRSHTVGSLSSGDGHHLHVGLAPVGELLTLQVRPESLDRVQLGRVGGQPPHVQPVPLPGQVLRHQLAPMGGQTVPEQDHLLAPEVPTELADELDQRVLVVGAILGLEVEPGAGAVPAVGEGGGHRDPLPVEGMAEDRGLAPGCPGAPDHRRQRGPAFVLEDDPGLLPAGEFFISGHSSRTQRAIASSSRSIARRAGFCQLQPSRRRIFQTCPTVYRIPVSIAITSATRSNVHSSVCQPYAAGPLSNARWTLLSSLVVSSAGRPARSAWRSPRTPSSCQARCQTVALCLDTPSSRATSAGRMPLAYSRAARSRRCSRAPRSRRPVPREPLLERVLELGFMDRPLCLDSPSTYWEKPFKWWLATTHCGLNYPSSRSRPLVVARGRGWFDLIGLAGPCVAAGPAGWLRSPGLR